MNFYIGNSIDSLDVSGENIEFSDELLDFICRKGKGLSCHTDKLCKINPYADAVIPLVDLPQIMEICSCFLHQESLQKGQYRDEWKQMLTGLMEIAQEAIYRGMGLISIGD